jgi:gliding motility-associated-like protein
MFDNIFTVEMAPNGDFVNGPIIHLIGQRIVAGNSTNQYIDVSFPLPPNNLLANTNYQVRIKGSSPLSYSPLNTYPFKIAKIGSLPEIPLFPETYWRGSFFTWKPSIPTIITDANTQDIFNPSNYLGYVTKADLSFDLNWGFDVESAPGTKFDTSHVCGSHANFYSIRMRRKINFEAGYYIFGGGGDDGFRLSIDSGATWLINLWADHEFAGKLNNNGCGVYLATGPKNVVVDYYERAEQSRFQVIIKRTGDPLVTPLTISNPNQGASICLQSTPFQMLSNAPGGESWSGPGVSPGGIFDPQSAGLGTKTITYETGMAGFGSNCLKSTSVSVQIVPGLSSEFTGLDTSYCQGDSSVKLIPQNPGGTFWGEGVSGSNFKPASVLAGTYVIQYALSPTSGCGSDTVRKNVTILAKPDAGFQDLPDSVYSDSPNISLIPAESGGIFTGDGVISTTKQWIPSVLPAGEYAITYSLTKGGCSNLFSQKVKVLGMAKPELDIPNMFTPNSDGKNDQWTVKGGTSGIKVTIINRWGKEVYKGTSVGETLCKVEDLPEMGLYFFLLENPVDNKKWTGTLTVSR